MKYEQNGTRCAMRSFSEGRGFEFWPDIQLSWQVICALFDPSRKNPGWNLNIYTNAFPISSPNHFLCSIPTFNAAVDFVTEKVIMNLKIYIYIYIYIIHYDGVIIYLLIYALFGDAA
jgi:hypothetical protein